MIPPRILLKLFRTLLEPISGKREYQALFERLHGITLDGMGMGSGAYTGESSEKAAIQYIRQKFKSSKPIICFDVGGNKGQFTTLLHEVLGSEASIHTFEPSSATFKVLKENTARFPEVQLHQKGLGDQPGKLQLFTNEDASLIASVYQRKLDHFGIQMNQFEEIEVDTLDNFCQHHSIPHIHFLKLDVEGHELKVLKGAEKLVQNQAIDFIQFEFGGCNIDSRTYFQDFYYLLSDQYTLYRIVKDGLYPIKGYRETYEAFVTTNYLAERKGLVQ